MSEIKIAARTGLHTSVAKDGGAPGVSAKIRALNPDVEMFALAAGLRAAVTRPVTATASREPRGGLLEPVTPVRVASALGETCARWREHVFAPRRETVTAISAAWGWSEALLDQSIDALLAPLNRDTLAEFARRAPRRKDLVGLIMPGNIPGAGIHEFAIGLIAGCALMVKTATAEPVFFARFARTLRQVDAEVGARVAVINWGRERADLTAALRSSCDWFAAYGDDETIARLGSIERPAAANDNGSGRMAAGFGGRVSGALVAPEVATGVHTRALAAAIARDVSLFEQQGCLSPHHIFVESPDGGAAREFARELAHALERCAVQMPPPRRYGLEEAAAVRRVRESARWRAIGGEAVVMWESPRLGWTVICDQAALFAPSPGYRTVTVSPVVDGADLARRLQPVAGRIEAFAIAAPAFAREAWIASLAALGVCYLCEPGAMQSPPLDWSHGGGAFLKALANSR
jgi:Acyl-CoA reductase (LuxC)